MFATVVLAFAFMLLMVAAMAIGAIINGRTIKGSCGGIANIPGVEPVPCVCEKPCDKKLARMAAEQEAKPIEFDLHKKR
ncbi:MAG: (Na+)-NQR maturation NqrM [Granulosicoccaceae bacterium]